MADAQPWFAHVILERAAPPAGDVVFVSTDSHGAAGPLVDSVIEQLELPPTVVPEAEALKRGFAIVRIPDERSLCFVMTGPTGAALKQNLSKCLSALGELPGRRLWLPLMGTDAGSTGAGALSEEESLDQTLRAFEESNASRARGLSITISAPKGIAADRFQALMNIVKALPAPDTQAPLPQLVRDTAEMQDDQPTETDVLGRAEFAASLALRLDRLVVPPGAKEAEAADRTSLMLQLHAPWGAGKTSFMRFLSASLKALPESRWTVVWFNAWENQRIDPPWWMLYDTIYRTLLRTERTKRLSLACKELWWRLTVGNGTNLLLIGLGILTFGILLSLSSDTWFTQGTRLDEIVKSIAAVLALATTITGVVRTALNGLLAGGSKAAQGFTEIAQDPMTKLRLHYEAVVAHSERKILVIVDDLDRCIPAYLIKLLEGMQTMFAHPSVAWIVAADRRWLAAAFEAGLPEGITVAEPGNRLGYQFLEKAFQLTIALPQINDDVKEIYWRRIVGDAPCVGADGLNDATKRELDQQTSEAGILGVLDRAKNLAPEEKTVLRREAVKRMASKEIDVSVEHFLTAFSPLIKPNPRSMKRLVNSYTVFRDLAILRGLPIAAGSGDRRELARWVILNMDAPLLLDVLEQQPDLLENGAPGKPPSSLDKTLQPLWQNRRIQSLLFGYSDPRIELGKLTSGRIEEFAPLRG